MLFGSAGRQRGAFPPGYGAASETLPNVPSRTAAIMGASAPAGRMGLPGPIGGFGGGTWNVDGSAATPDRNGAMRPLPGTGNARPHWTVEGFDKMRSEMPPVEPMPQPGGPLGNSMRQPFDYDAALAKLVGEKPKIKDWQKVAGVIGDALVMNQGGQPYVMKSLMGRQEAYQDRLRKAQETLLGWQHNDYAAQRDADLRAANPFSSGRDRVQYDPATGQARVIYDGPEDFETYAEELSLEPGTDEYFAAVEDYVLKGNGPTAHGRDLELDDHRTSNDRSLESYRYGNRVGLEKMRQGNRQGMVDYRNANPAPARPRVSGAPRDKIVTVSSPAEARKLPKGTKFRTPDGKIKVVP